MSSIIYFLRFMNNGTKETKLQILIRESKDCAVLDISWLAMVCAYQSLESYLAILSDLQHSHITKSIFNFYFHSEPWW